MKRKFLVAIAAASLYMGTASAMRPVTIVDQGSFFAGGTVAETPGRMDFQKPLNQHGQTMHGDHAYVFYQRPANAKQYPLVFLHGAGQSAKTWETTPDGRDGFQNIFLERGFSTYLVDQPRRGKAGQSTQPAALTADTYDQFWFSNFRVGNWDDASHSPGYFDGVQFSKTKEALNQYLRQMTPNTGPYDAGVISDAMAAVFDKSGEGVFVTHSQGGGIGWLTIIKSDKVKGVVAYEPGSGFIFPEGETPQPVKTTHPMGDLAAVSVPMPDFLKLTKIPIIIFYGDYIADEYTEAWNADGWRARLEMARLWAETVNRHGGDATVVHLPDVGVTGNTHFPFSDLNNIEVADLMEAWLQEKGLAE